MAVLPLLHLLDKLGIDLVTTHSLHHSEMFEVVVSLEQGIPCVELHQDAANAPDVTGETPAEIQYNLGSPIVSRRHDRRMILVIESSRPEVDKPDLTVQQYTALTCVSIGGVGGRGDGSVVREGLIRIVHEENVLGLQVRVDEVEVVKDCTRG